MRVLVARLQALIRRSHGQILPILRSAGLSLDEDRQAVIRDGVPCALSGVEFRLLRYMMLHPGKVLSKSELGEHVYANDSDKESNVIEVHVNHLRNKIGNFNIEVGATAPGRTETGRRAGPDRQQLLVSAIGIERIGRQFTIAVAADMLPIRDRDLDIATTISPVARFRGDREDLIELCGNLLDNACKWARHQVRVSIGVDSADGFLLTIEDDGPGCPDADLERIAERGVRLDEATAGHGLGLAIVRDIVSSYGGGLSLGRSSRLGGMLVSVSIPASGGLRWRTPGRDKPARAS